MSEAAEQQFEKGDGAPRRNRPHYVFVWPNMEKVGGIQVLIRDACTELIARNIAVSVVCDSGPFADSLPAGCDLIDLRFQRNPSLLSIDRILGSDANILCFNATSAAIGLGLHERLSLAGRSVKLLVGIYHPRVFFSDAEGRLLQRILLSKIFRSLGSQSVFYMNRGCQLSHAEVFGDVCSESRIIALPVKGADRVWQARKRDPLRICSVGRIVSFKAYNFHAREIVESLERQGISVEWDIFGHGEDEARLKQDLSTSRKVRFLGALDNFRVTRTVANYDLFVGMGTAAVHAAQVGVPVIVALESGGSFCLGYGHEMPAGNVGEADPSIKPVSLEEKIKHYAMLSADERTTLSLMQASWSDAFSFPKFFEEVGAAFDVATFQDHRALRFWSSAYLRALRLKALLRRKVGTSVAGGARP